MAAPQAQDRDMERECKVAVESHDPVRSRLRAAGGAYTGRVLETNRLLDRADGSLQREGRGLRVRTAVALDGNTPPATVTMKGPMQSSVYKLREEIEVEVADGEATVDLLKALGYEPHIVFEKRRESWQLGRCRVELDELPGLGCFVEIEGPDDATIRAVAEKLGVDDRQSIRESYAALIASRAGPGRSVPLVVRF